MDEEFIFDINKKYAYSYIKLIKNGYCDFEVNFDTKKITFRKGECPFISKDERILDLIFIFKKYMNKNISLNIRLSKRCFATLRNALKKDVEVSGCLSLQKENNYYKLILNRLENKNSGNSTEVDITFNRYTFHTHPELNYKEFDIINGFPSKQDYEYFLSAYEQGTILHTVISVEGVYIITLKQKNMELPEELFEKYFYEGNREPISEYIKDINLYTPFSVNFLTWEEIQNNKVLNITFI